MEQYLEFDWNPAKAASNFRKHTISFELAATVFNDPLMLTIADRGHSEFEERWLSMGYGQDGRLLVVSHTCSEIGDSRISVRIISARRASRNERDQYESHE